MQVMEGNKILSVEKCGWDTMLNVGTCGWASLVFDKYYFSISYLTDFPLDILREIDGYLNNKYSMSVFFDEEGSFGTLVVTQYNVYVISERGTDELIKFDIRPEDFIKQIIKDIESEIENVYNWIDHEDDAKEIGILDEYLNRKNEINKLLKKIKERLVELSW